VKEASFTQSFTVNELETAGIFVEVCAGIFAGDADPAEI